MLSADVLALWHAQHHGKSCEGTECWASLDRKLSSPEAELRICILDAAAGVIENHRSEHARIQACSKWPRESRVPHETGATALLHLCTLCHLPWTCCPGVSDERTKEQMTGCPQVEGSGKQPSAFFVVRFLPGLK